MKLIKIDLQYVQRLSFIKITINLCLMWEIREVLNFILSSQVSLFYYLTNLYMVRFDYNFFKKKNETKKSDKIVL